MEVIEAGNVAPAPAAAVQPAVTRYGLEFRGSTGEYFRIWIVNLALSVLTLGIYSAWAKVRRLKYLHGHTYLAGSAFGYHGDPRKILKGRMIASLFLVAYVALSQFSPVLGGVAGLALGLATPWLVVKSLKFRLRMTSWRGLRFDFDEDFAEAYRVYLGWGALAVLSLGLLMPPFVRRLNKFIVDHSAYGTTWFECDPSLRRIWFATLRAAGFAIVAGIVLTVLFGALLWISGDDPEAPSAAAQLFPLAIVLVLYLGGYAIFNAGVVNAVYDSTRLGPHRLHSNLSGWRLAWIYFSNTVAIIVSLGLLVPWATIRTLRYRFETMGLTAVGSLDDFVASEAAAAPTAAGEEIADFFDVDFGL